MIDFVRCTILRLSSGLSLATRTRTKSWAPLTYCALRIIMLQCTIYYVAMHNFCQARSVNCRHARLSCAGPEGCAGVGCAVKGTRCGGYCDAILSAFLTARSPARGHGHTHKEPRRETHADAPTKGWTRRGSVRILFSWNRRRRRAIGGCGLGIWNRMR
jgi:hypothetical protein